MEVATTTLEFLDREQKFYKESKEISVDMFGKGPTVLHMFSLVCVFLKITLKH